MTAARKNPCSDHSRWRAEYQVKGRPMRLLSGSRVECFVLARTNKLLADIIN
jgi:hypothetical protein